MVKEYLEKTRNGFMEEKISLMEQVTFLQNSMKQNMLHSVWYADSM